MTARTRRRRRNGGSDRAQAPRLIGYCRVSSDEQARNGVSLADQAERIEAHAKANGYQLVRIESDRGVSGYKAPEKRPAMKRALAAVKAGEADGIVAIATNDPDQPLIEVPVTLHVRDMELDMLKLDFSPRDGVHRPSRPGSIWQPMRARFMSRTSTPVSGWPTFREDRPSICGLLRPRPRRRFRRAASAIGRRR